MKDVAKRKPNESRVTVKQEEDAQRRKRGRPRNCERGKVGGRNCERGKVGGRNCERGKVGGSPVLLANIKVEADCPPVSRGRRAKASGSPALPIAVKEENLIPFKRMASLDAMAKMHVICTTERKAPSWKALPLVGVKRERPDSTESVVRRRQSTVPRKEERPSGCASRSEKSRALTARPKASVKKKVGRPKVQAGDKKSLCRPKASDKKSLCPPKAGDKKSICPPKAVDKKSLCPPKAGDKKSFCPPKAGDKKSLSQAFDKKSLSSPAMAEVRGRRKAKCEEAEGGYSCSVGHHCKCASPQILAPPPRCPLHRILYSPPRHADCGCCCCSGSLVRDSCLLREDVVACAHLCACCALHRDGRRQGCLQYLSSGKSGLSSESSGGESELPQQLCCRDLIFLRRASAPHSCFRCSEPSGLPSRSATSLTAAPDPGKVRKRKFAHGWIWDGSPVEKLIWLTSESAPCPRRCYPAVRHKEGDLVRERDCVLLRSGPKDTDLPYVAKVAAFWENPEDGEMMMSLLWYYRPEHTEQGRRPGHAEDEVFASRHRDANSVACIEDRCFVLTFAEYCRYRARLRRGEEAAAPPVAPAPPGGYPRRCRLPPCTRAAPDRVLFCRAVYDFRQRRTLKNPA